MHGVGGHSGVVRNGIVPTSGVPFRRRENSQRGFVLITMAVSAVALLGALGLVVDIGRMFITKNETQAFCDSAALAAALALDGTTDGIAAARAAVTNSTNSWNLSTTRVANPTIVFATTLAGPWAANPNPASGYMYARVSATSAMQLYFLPAVVARQIQDVSSTATAGQVPLTSFPRGLAPYTGVSTNTTGPNFGLVVGGSYDLQWPQYNSSRAGCGPGNPDKCFNSPPCGDEPKASKAAVVANWGANINGYWGATANSTIRQQILDVIQLQAVEIGTNIQPVLTNGNKASEAIYLDERASQDVNTTDNTVDGYLSHPHNGRRLIPVPIVNPTDPFTTTVIGYGQFLLLANGPGVSNYYARTTNGNDPFCAIYAGPYNVGGIGPGAGGATGATYVRLVE
jgi:Flp pilus assembly protein TadG